jgi:hypothetical protein
VQPSVKKRAFVVCHKPGTQWVDVKTLGIRFNQHLARSLYKAVKGGMFPKDFPALDSPRKGMLQYIC